MNIFPLEIYKYMRGTHIRGILIAYEAIAKRRIEHVNRGVLYTCSGILLVEM